MKRIVSPITNDVEFHKFYRLLFANLVVFPIALIQNLRF